MTIAILQAPDMQMEVNLYPLPDLSEDDFFHLCQANSELRFERTAKGEILIMPPEGGESGHGNAVLITAVQNWARIDSTGAAFGSSAGFRLPNGATRAPDAAWVLRRRLAELTAEQKRKFLPLCPDFVIELRSPTDRPRDLQAKMDEYIANGARLGWLIDPDARTVLVYRPGQPVVRLDNPTAISGDPELPGFVLDLGEIWEPGF